jgi:TPR repeat protein
MKLIPIFLLVGMLAVSGWAEEYKLEPYSPELVKKAEAGDAVAQNDLGVCFSEGAGVAQDKKEAVRWYRKAAVNGNAIAQGNLGTCYFIGSGVEQDKREAVKWFTKSAEQGFSVMQFMLGTCYETGEGVGKDMNEAVKWYTKAKENGIDEAVQRMRRIMEDQSNGK